MSTKGGWKINHTKLSPLSKHSSLPTHMDQHGHVGVTGNVLSEQVAEFVAAGADAVLPKPMSMPELLAMLGARFQPSKQKTFK